MRRRRRSSRPRNVVPDSSSSRKVSDAELTRSQSRFIGHNVATTNCSDRHCRWDLCWSAGGVIWYANYLISQWSCVRLFKSRFDSSSSKESKEKLNYSTISCDGFLGLGLSCCSSSSCAALPVEHINLPEPDNSWRLIIFVRRRYPRRFFAD